MEANGKAFYPNEPTPIKNARLPARCLVTGAAGMVGGRLVSMLAERGASHVVCLDVAAEPTNWEQKRVAAEKLGCRLQYMKCDILDNEALRKAFEGVEVCFHVAALVGPFFKHELYMKVNFVGAQNIVAACKAAGTPVLVDCSSPSTRFDGKDIEGRTETQLAYAHLHEYARTKALGEKEILDANSEGLATCAIAPHQVYGPSDLLFLPNLLATARKGMLRVFGEGRNVVSFTHVDNICYGLLLGGIALRQDGHKSKAAGEFIVITDGDCHNFWDAVDDAVVQSGFTSLHAKFHLPVFLLRGVAYVGGVIEALTGKQVKITPFTVQMLLIHRYFSVAKARHLLGYAPLVRFEEGWPASVNAIKERLGY